MGKVGLVLMLAAIFGVPYAVLVFIVGRSAVPSKLAITPVKRAKRKVLYPL